MMRLVKTSAFLPPFYVLIPEKCVDSKSCTTNAQKVCEGCSLQPGHTPTLTGQRGGASHAHKL